MRTFVAMILVVIFMALYAALAATIGGKLVSWPVWIQLLYYAIAGIIWVFPLKPLMDWMKRAPSPKGKD